MPPSRIEDHEISTTNSNLGDSHSDAQDIPTKAEKKIHSLKPYTKPILTVLGQMKGNQWRGAIWSPDQVTIPGVAVSLNQFDLGLEQTPPMAEQVEPRDSRSEERAATMFRPILIDIDGFSGFCLVRNLSSNGMKGRVYAHFAIGKRVKVRFAGDMAIEGEVVWASDGQIGVQFDEPIEVSTVLSALVRSAPGGQVNRAPRLPIDCDGELVIADRTLAIDVQDISQRGIKVRASYVRTGDEVTVRLAGLEPRKAVVRWTRPGTAGLVFLRPLALEELASWVVARHRATWGSVVRPAASVGT
ncbi:MAG: hypothetical protein NVS3B5_18470 [Sphingomicrobium sp.]